VHGKRGRSRRRRDPGLINPSELAQHLVQGKREGEAGEGGIQG